MSKGIDRATAFTQAECEILKAHGYSFIGRYYSLSAWKRLTLKEAQRISAAGLFVVAVYQDAGRDKKSFTAARGAIHAANAIQQAKACGQPVGTPIYFAVDFDAKGAGGLGNVVTYFGAVVKGLAGSGYTAGVYGSADVTDVVATVKGVTHKWQTIAWSKGEVTNYNLLQYKIDTPLPEAPTKLRNVDLCKSNGNGGGWKVAK
jgi:hypothetical protein